MTSRYATIKSPPHNFPPTPPSEPVALQSSPVIKSVIVEHTPSAVNAMQTGSTQHKHIWLITGPAGCGKTSVAEHLHSVFGFPYLEGDAYHPPANVQKMASGQPLTDADRWDWLVELREQALITLQQQVSTSTSLSGEDIDTSPSGVIVTCSALKRKYRDVMRIANYNHHNVLVHFVFLQAPKEVLLDRVRARKNHYMKDSMVDSQFESLEDPQPDEADIIPVDASLTPAEVQSSAVEAMGRLLEQDSVI